MADHLLRRFAPITDQAWKVVDDEARERLSPRLAARRLVDWAGPHGWTYSATPLGRARTLDDGPSAGGERVRTREVLPVTEFRVPFTVARAELDDAARGATDLGLDDLDRAATRAAECENAALLHGWPAAGIRGVTEACSQPARPLGEVPELPHTVATAVNTLRCAGIDGPYAMAIGPAGYTAILEATEHGRPLLDHLQQILGGEIVRAPGMGGAVVLSARGGDFALEVGQDFAVGYLSHDAEHVSFYLEESFTFRVVEADAAVVLTE